MHLSHSMPGIKAITKKPKLVTLVELLILFVVEVLLLELNLME